MKRPAAAVEDAVEAKKACKTKAADSGTEVAAPEVEEENGEEQQENRPQLKDGKEEAAESREALRAMARKSKDVERLTRERDALAAKVKANRSALSAAEKELEELKLEAKKKVRKAAVVKGNYKAAVARKKAIQNEGLLAAKAEKATAGRLAARATAKAAKQRFDAAKEAVAVASTKEADAKKARSRSQAKLDEALKLCKDLAAKGEDVPDEDDNSRDITAPGSWKPPGVRAAKERNAARGALVKADALLAKATEDLRAKEARLSQAKERFDKSKGRRQMAEERKDAVDAELASIAPKTSKAKAKAKSKAKGKAQAKVKAKGKAKAGSKGAKKR